MQAQYNFITEHIFLGHAELIQKISAEHLSLLI